MTFPIFDLPLDPREHFSLTFHRRTWTCGSELSFFLMIAALSRDNCDTSAFRFFSLFLSSSYILVRICPRKSHIPQTNPHIPPRDTSKDPPTNTCNASAILEDSLPPSDHFRYNRYRFEYRVDKLFCWHSCLREMSSRHPRDRRAKVVYQLHTSRNRCNPSYDGERFQIPHRFFKDIKYSIKLLN